MARYFDAANPEHVALLPVSLRQDEDLPMLAATAEQLAIAEYTRQEPHADALELDDGEPTQRYVWLRGFAVDADQANASLVEALRLEIAAVIRWRAALLNRKPNLASESAGEPSTTKGYRDDAENQLPPMFGQLVRPFAIRNLVWSL